MEPKKQPRSKQKIMLSETIAIRKMRESLKLDRKTAALLVEKSPKQLEKIENGYVEITPKLILHFLNGYSFKRTDFDLLLYESKLNLNKVVH